jgi:NADP-dependent 3-hydroxy acid dehydrogenase YdfG
MSPKLTGIVALVTGASRTTELMSHNTGPVREDIDHFHASTEVLVPEDIADGITYMVTRPRHTSISELWIMPTDQV